MKHNTHGGGTKPAENGYKYEKMTSLQTYFKQHGFEIHNQTLCYKDKAIGLFLEKRKLYKWLDAKQVPWRHIVSKRLLPDDCLYVHDSNTVYILEKKYQESPGSVDEKLQTCDFKKRTYQKLFAPLGIRVKMVYWLSEWFHQPCYQDSLEYIEDTGCQYFFGEIPLEYFLKGIAI